jgi:alpha-D-ribose 1-methylphosphonate 5-triphosphate synthase subunit PhnI
MQEAMKAQERYSAAAKWEANLGKRDMAATRKLQEDRLRNDTQLTDIKVKQIRHEKLRELFTSEEKMYEDELNKLGLATCHDQL